MDLPIDSMVIFHSFLYLYQRVAYVARNIPWIPAMYRKWFNPLKKPQAMDTNGLFNHQKLGIYITWFHQKLEISASKHIKTWEMCLSKIHGSSAGHALPEGWWSSLQGALPAARSRRVKQPVYYGWIEWDVCYIYTYMHIHMYNHT